VTFTFTFTLNCHLGKTHDHRSRGDTPWRAQTTHQDHTQACGCGSSQVSGRQKAGHSTCPRECIEVGPLRLRPGPSPCACRPSRIRTSHPPRGAPPAHSCTLLWHSLVRYRLCLRHCPCSPRLRWSRARRRGCRRSRASCGLPRRYPPPAPTAGRFGRDSLVPYAMARTEWIAPRLVA
jgi:hypothetical protein